MRFKNSCWGRAAAIGLILTLSVLPLAAQASMGRLLYKAGVWITSTLFSYAVGKGIDHYTGSNIERELEALKEDLESKIRDADRESARRLHETLEVASSELRMVKKLLEGKPSREEFQDLRDQVNADLAKVFSQLDRHENRLDKHENQLDRHEGQLGLQQAQIEDLRRRLESLEEFYPRRVGPVPDDLPYDPRVTVLAIGEPTLAGALEAELEKQLHASGLEVKSGSRSLQLVDLLKKHGESIQVGRLVPFLVADGQHVLVLVRAEIAGYRELTYYGRVSTATDARLRFNAYLLHDERALARGWNEPVLYTALNAEYQASEAVAGTVAELSEVIKTGWRSHRAKAGR